MKFIHLSDVHFKEDDFHLYGLDPSQRLKRAIDSINKNQHDADFIVITGDLADEGELKAYEKLDKLLESCEPEVIKLIGNHDNRENFLKVFSSSFQHEGFIQGSKRVGDKTFIFLDTKIPNTHAGDMCDVRFTWLEQQLEANKDQDVYLFMHHPPMDVDIGYMDKIGFKSQERLKTLLLKYDNIGYMFLGHLHRVINGTWANIPFFGIRGTNHQVAFKSSIEKLYSTNEEQPAYGVVNIKAQEVLIHVHEYLNEENYYTSFD
jgi:3',5'-cyclic AMP phosphodiesterase CpdA